VIVRMTVGFRVVNTTSTLGTMIPSQILKRVGRATQERTTCPLARKSPFASASANAAAQRSGTTPWHDPFAVDDAVGLGVGSSVGTVEPVMAGDAVGSCGPQPRTARQTIGAPAMRASHLRLAFQALGRPPVGEET
jgi:hypothetical protein